MAASTSTWSKPWLLSAWQLLFMLLFPSVFSTFAVAYRPGDIVPMSRMGQYHSSRTVWHDLIGRHCPIFAVNREVLMPIPKPTGYTGADPYKISFQVGREKFLIPWLLIVNRKSTEVPMIEVELRYSGNDFHGVTAKVVDMPHHYVEIHPEIRKQFWDSQHWPKHILVRYTWLVLFDLRLNIFILCIFCHSKLKKEGAFRYRCSFWILRSVWFRAHVIFHPLNLYIAIITGKIGKICKGDCCRKQHAW
ncbi:uncharacterized protein LOC107639590 isoform X1 [Arachis ipaensis]|uniref:uncharacterized protein LOC107639590 isoform X1 n=1 Tax=Arachis ipaensis TaxID=130454 RepID=UPI000A2B7B11|nr:uncharacterized protein LOC107639590 isoform X1 [Arachis ipaensis]